MINTIYNYVHAKGKAEINRIWRIMKRFEFGLNENEREIAHQISFREYTIQITSYVELYKSEFALGYPITFTPTES